MAFTDITLTGSYADRPNGDPARGYVSFQLSHALINGTVIAPAVLEKAHLLDGSFSIVLPATTDTDTRPTGATYTVTEKIEGAIENTYEIELVHTDTTQDLADLTPTTNTSVSYSFSSGTLTAPFGWENLPAAQTALQGGREVGSTHATLPVVMTRNGSITAIAVAGSAARSAGQAIFYVFKNGVVTGLQAVIAADNTQYRVVTAPTGTYTFSSTDRLDVRVGTDSSWSPTTSEWEATIELRFN